jgi:hypothetical protein
VSGSKKKPAGVNTLVDLVDRFSFGCLSRHSSQHGAELTKAIADEGVSRADQSS